MSTLLELIENKDFIGFKKTIGQILEEAVAKKFSESLDEITNNSKFEDLTEAVKIDVDFDDTDADIKSIERKYGIKIQMHKDGAYLTGDKEKLKKYLLSKDYGLDKEDLADLYPELL